FSVGSKSSATQLPVHSPSPANDLPSDGDEDATTASVFRAKVPLRARDERTTAHCASATSGAFTQPHSAPLSGSAARQVEVHSLFTAGRFASLACVSPQSAAPPQLPGTQLQLPFRERQAHEPLAQSGLLLALQLAVQPEPTACARAVDDSNDKHIAIQA